ncbi:MAG: MBL fold metallo-hydrolase, partial [Opitutaceae bacterium]
MKRTFHPVGQGAFYSERHNCNGKKFTIVYDCGSMTYFGNHLKSIVESAFPKEESEKKPIIDILFISHFHADHINGIKHLKNHCEIRKVVMPLIDNSAKFVLKINNRIIGDSDDDELIDNPKIFFGENVEVVAISEYGKENETNSEPEVVIYPSGEKFRTNQNDNWFFIPYNYRHDEGVELFRQTLANFGINLNNIDIETVVGNQIIKNTYSVLDKDLNKNSMILYSGKDRNCFLEFKPKKNPPISIVDKIRTIKYFRHFGNTQIGCLYTGDIDLLQRGIISEIKNN